MKRSEINQILREAKAFLRERSFLLPPWAYWSMQEWRENRDNAEEVISSMLGWDITDFGSGDFRRRGLFLFTIRNGKPGAGNKPYAEKVMIVEENQETPMHYHWTKMEDIINRGGGNLIIELYNSTPDNRLDTTDVHFTKDGIKGRVKAGGKVILSGQFKFSHRQAAAHNAATPGEVTQLPMLTVYLSMVMKPFSPLAL
jgi:D-lyxose ketol-isomerase